MASIVKKIQRLLERSGLGSEAGFEEADPLFRDQPLLAELYGASVQGRITCGSGRGERLKGHPRNHTWAERMKRVWGFDVLKCDSCGGQALTIGLARPDLFHYVLGFSTAVGGPFMNAEAEFQSALAAPETLNSRIRVLWVGSGKQDFLYQANRPFVDLLKKTGVPVRFQETEGSHVWSVWRNYLYETAPMLFRNAPGKE